MTLLNLIKALKNPAKAGYPVRRDASFTSQPLWNTGSPAFAGDDGWESVAPYCDYLASCTLLRKRWIRRSMREDQPSPLPRNVLRMRALTGSTSASALARKSITKR